MNDWNGYNTTTFVNPQTGIPYTAPQLSMVATLNQATLDVIRQIIREEIEAARADWMAGVRSIIRVEIGDAFEQREKHDLDSLMADISEPVDEQEEMAAVLATMTPAEWETLVQRVKERKASE